MKKRIIGIDVARALAVFGMIIVNFKMVLGGEGDEWAKTLVGIFEGKAAATFVVLAGVGLAMMSKKALDDDDAAKLKLARRQLIKRSVFLFVIGLSYMVIWPADILHFYGIYMLLVLLVLNKPPKTALTLAAILVLVYPILMLVWSYDQGWDFDTFNYLDFWTIDGFFRNLFYNGFHPVIPWAAFMLVGFWFGRQNLFDQVFVYRTLRISIVVFAGTQLTSILLLNVLSGDDPSIHSELSQILGTSPMPPLPLYMISGTSIALAVICFCILLANKFSENKIIDALNKTGKLALTFYVMHVVIGMGLPDLIFSQPLGSYSVSFSLAYALVFSLLCVVFAVIWSKYKKVGPLEWVMRKLTN